MLDIRRIGREQDQGTQTGRADRIALGDRLGGIAHRVQRVRGLANLVVQPRHFCDAAGIVRHRTEGIERHDHPGQGQHGRHGNGNAEQAGQIVGDHDADDDDQRRQGRGFQRHGQALDHIRAMPRLGGFRDGFHRPVGRAGIVFRHPDDGCRHRQADQARQEEVLPGDHAVPDHADLAHPVGKRVLRDQPDTADREHTGRDQPLVERAHHIGGLAQGDEEGADDRGHDADRANGQRIGHQGRAHVSGKEDRGQNHRGHHGHRIRLKQIGRHAGTVTDIVAHIVRDRGGIARVILGNAGFDLADHVPADIRTLGENAAAQTGEDGDQRGPEAQRDERVDHDPVPAGMAHASGEDQVVARHAQQGEPGHQHPGDSPRAEGNAQSRGQAGGGCLGGADIGPDRDEHADETGRSRQNGADRKAQRDFPAEENGDEDADDNAHDTNRCVLALEICVRAFLNGRCNFLHLLAAGTRAHQSLCLDDSVDDGEYGCGNGQQNYVHGFQPRFFTSIFSLRRKGGSIRVRTTPTSACPPHFSYRYMKTMPKT